MISNQCGAGRSGSGTGFELLQRTIAGFASHPNFGGLLLIGLQCGGSDAFSSLTANPALGHAVDLLVRHGGTAILSETPEIHGVEHMLTRRAQSPQVAQALIDRIEWWRQYTRDEADPFSVNPSFTAHAGGLTSVVEQSLGAAMKGGTTNLRAVYEYAEPVTERGLVFMDSPGFDPCLATGQIASGATVICFTTARGSAFGAKPVPSLKLATTSMLYHRHAEDMDINCGTILDGDETLVQCGERIFTEILAVACGRRTKSEEYGYGDNEFVPWQLGAVF